MNFVANFYLVLLVIVGRSRTKIREFNETPFQYQLQRFKKQTNIESGRRS